MSYDSLTHRLWVGLKSESTSVSPDLPLLECELAKYRHINRNFSLIGMSDFIFIDYNKIDNLFCKITILLCLINKYYDH